MKFPKTVLIDGRDWKIVIDKNINGACIDTGKVELVIGTKEGEGLKNFIHECLETILIYNMLRFKNIRADFENGNMIFVFNHDQFEKACTDLSVPIRQLLKANGVK